MKKLVLFFAVVVAVSFASCGNKAKTEAPEAEATEVVADEAPVTTTDTTAAAATEAAPATETAAPVAE